METTAFSVTETFWVVVVFVLVVSGGHYLTSRPKSGGPTRWARLWAALIMWSERRSAARAAGMESVYIPVSQYGMDAGGMETETPAAPDIDAANADMPRLSRTLADSDIIVLLAAQRGKDGKHRYSANAIQILVGGDRNAVMATIKELRAVPAPAQFRQPDGSTAPASRPVTS